MEQADRRIDEIKHGPPIPHPITSCSIPSPQIQEVSPLQVYPSFPIIECSILSPPVQQVEFLKTAPMQKVIECQIISPPIQQVVKLKVAPVHKVIETPVPTALIQQVKSLWFSSPMKLISPPVIPHLKPITDLSFFWNPEVEDTNEITSPSKVTPSPSCLHPKLEPEYSDCVIVE